MTPNTDTKPQIAAAAVVDRKGYLSLIAVRVVDFYPRKPK